MELAKRGVNVTFSQVLLDDAGKESWVSRTTVLVPARHKFGKDGGAKGKPTTLVEDARAEGCVIFSGDVGVERVVCF